MRRNGRDAPIPDLRALTPKRGGSTQSRRSPGRETPAARDPNSACPATVCTALLKSSAMLACETRPSRLSVQIRLDPPQVWISRSARVDLLWPICAMVWDRGTEVFARLFPQDLHLGVKSFLKLLSHLGRLSGPGWHPDGSRRGNLPFGAMLGSDAA